jgi:pimeloyl-ACP methyl ester carboxylesterase
MNKQLGKRVAKILGAILILLVLVVAIGPFLIPVSALEGLVTPQEAARAESQFVTIPFAGTDGIDIHYLADEAGRMASRRLFYCMDPTSMRLPGMRCWTIFDQRGRVIAYDQIPYGLSEKLVVGDWTERNPYTVDAAVEQLITLLDTFGVEKAVLVGNSYGSVLALEAALAYPDRVEALILADSAVYVSESLPPAVMNLPRCSDWARFSVA